MDVSEIDSGRKVAHRKSGQILGGSTSKATHPKNQSDTAFLTQERRVNFTNLNRHFQVPSAIFDLRRRKKKSTDI